MKSQFVFFSGKGGVGKTSMACTTAVRHADMGLRTLIVTTDPASNLADVFEQPIGHKITAIEDVSNLWAMEIDSDRATEEYIDRAMAPIRAAFPPSMVQVMEEQMSGPCTAEVAAFDRFVDFLELPETDSNGGNSEFQFDVVIFDTAPTGHTLRLLELPVEWSRSINESEQGSGQTCIGPTAAIQDAKQKYERAVTTLRDESQTTFTFVLQPEATALKETHRAIAELKKLDIHAHELIVNGIIPPEAASSPLFADRQKMQADYLAQIAREFPLPVRRMYLLSSEIKGTARIREVGRVLFDREDVTESLVGEETSEQAPAVFQSADNSTLRERLTPNGHRRTVFFAGKGGVGKTVASCLTAVWLAREGYKTLLLTTDPAAHLGDVLGVPVTDEIVPVAGVPNLWATNVDPKAAADEYRARILDGARRQGRPQEAIEMMEEELNSPCTEEMAAFDRFIDFASQSEWQVIVFDTAPTGHTLRLLELPIDWSKQLDVKIFASVDSAAADDVAKQRFSSVIDMMRDPSQSTFAFVMYPESTPIIEAYRASEELGTVGIETGLVVANLIIPPEHATTPYSRARRSMQQKYMAEIGDRFSAPVLQIPLLPYEVQGIDILTELAECVYGPVSEPVNELDKR
ncbi:MAG TPA: TRC40/GET3/ArsA family transport-energizing ATPase [Bellilinea sp.]|nr:TRC40/GET3/ArsA family transport-energizing ATPase [Bellilinea sp.]